MNTPDGKPYSKSDIRSLIEYLYSQGHMTIGEYDSIMFYLGLE